MKAFGNHFCVDDDTSRRLQTYNSGVASVFHVPIEDARDVAVNYVGIVKDILKLNYRSVHTPVILLRCEWVRGHDNRGNSTYIRDEAGFLFVNFQHKMPKPSDASVLLGRHQERRLEGCFMEWGPCKMKSSGHSRRVHHHYHYSRKQRPNSSSRTHPSTRKRVFSWGNWVIHGG
jgi:hypothetical protein